MRIAVTYEEGVIFQHFCHTENFKIYDIKEGKVEQAQVISSNGSGHGALATLLAPAEAGIKLYGGVSGDADAAVEALLQDSLEFNPNVKCNHHGEGHEDHGNCGSGGCGSHSCGH